MSTKTRPVKKRLFWIAGFRFFLKKFEKALYCKEKPPVENHVENVDNDL